MNEERPDERERERERGKKVSNDGIETGGQGGERREKGRSK